MSSDLSIARPYAKAVFQLAKQTQQFDAWSQMLSNAALIVSCKPMKSIIKDPAFSRQELEAFIIDLGQDSFTQPMQALLRLLGRFKRLLFLPAIAELFESYRNKEQRIVKVELISAFALNEQERQNFMHALKQKLHENIELECKTDPSILGGAIIQAGDWVVDGSVKGKLNKLCDAMGIY